MTASRPYPVAAVPLSDEGAYGRRADPPFAADERTMLTAFLDFHRATVRVKCTGVSEADARRSLLPTPAMTLAGLVSHLRWAEYFWFEHKLAGVDRPDWEVDNWHPAPDVSMAQLLDAYDAQCARSREIAAGLALTAVSRAGRRPATLRWVLLHMVEETARHNGHADLLRELLDGEVGV